MDKRLRIAGIVGAIIFSIIVLTSPDDPIPLPKLPSAEFENNSIEILAENLEIHGQWHLLMIEFLLQKKMAELE